ncbi:hypothetical protein D3C72_2063850 [compost metagenome]
MLTELCTDRGTAHFKGTEDERIKQLARRADDVAAGIVVVSPAGIIASECRIASRIVTIGHVIP